jgi:hypothetical protein
MAHCHQNIVHLDTGTMKIVIYILIFDIYMLKWKISIL